MMTLTMSSATASQALQGRFYPVERVPMLMKFIEVHAKRSKLDGGRSCTGGQASDLGLMFLMPFVELVVFDKVYHFLEKPCEKWFVGCLVLFFYVEPEDCDEFSKKSSEAC